MYQSTYSDTKRSNLNHHILEWSMIKEMGSFFFKQPKYLFPVSFYVQDHFFKCALPPNLKSWIRPCTGSTCLILALTSCFGLMTDSAVVDSALVDAALRKSGLISNGCSGLRQIRPYIKWKRIIKKLKVLFKFKILFKYSWI